MHGDWPVNVVTKLAVYPDICHRRERWGIAVASHWFVELDSSTPAKFSRHITLRLPGHAFACNTAVGAFICGMLATEQARRCPRCGSSAP